MAIYPNSDCYYLCVWMTDISAQRLTGPQITLTDVVKAAALAATSVTQVQWNDFNKFAQWRNPYYLVYKNYQGLNGSSLLVSAAAAFNFEGSSVNSVGNLASTDVSMSYGLSFGKITQGASFNGSGSRVGFTSISLGDTFTLSFWVYPISGFGNYAAVCANSIASQGAFMRSATNKIDFYYAGDHINNTALTLSAWNHIFIRCSQGSLTIYLNNVLDSSTFTGIAGISLSYLGSDTANEHYKGYIDAFTIWQRVLTTDEMSYIYNSGVGRQYPFVNS